MKRHNKTIVNRAKFYVLLCVGSNTEYNPPCPVLAGKQFIGLYDGAHAYPIRSTVLKTALGLSKKMNIYFVRKDRADDVKPHKLMNYGKGQAGSGRCLCEQGWWCRLLYKGWRELCQVFK